MNGHAWISFLNNSSLRYIDVYEGIINKNNNKNIYEYFMLTSQELYAKGKHSKFEVSTGFKVTNKNNKVQFKVINRSDEYR